jgi:cytoskeletal protein CcmA (bactofilin family)
MIFRRSKQKNNDMNGTPISGPSLIAQDVVIEGNVSASAELHIDGTVYGAVRAHSCVIDRNGFVQGEIVAEDVFIRGRVIGPIRGRNISLYSGALVEGDIFNESISIETGANIYGMISRVEFSERDEDADRATGGAGFATPTLSFGQDNSYRGDDGYRPIKVVNPR